MTRFDEGYLSARNLCALASTVAMAVGFEAPAAETRAVEWGPVQPEALAVCRQSTKSKKWVCNGALDNQIIVDEPTLESALERQRCKGGEWAAGGPTIDGVRWDTYRCGHSLGYGDYDVTKRYSMIAARRSYICAKNAMGDGRCETLYDGQDLRERAQKAAQGEADRQAAASAASGKAEQAARESRAVALQAQRDAQSRAEAQQTAEARAKAQQAQSEALLRAKAQQAQNDAQPRVKAQQAQSEAQARAAAQQAQREAEARATSQYQRDADARAAAQQQAQRDAQSRAAEQQAQRDANNEERSRQMIRAIEQMDPDSRNALGSILAVGIVVVGVVGCFNALLLADIDPQSQKPYSGRIGCGSLFAGTGGLAALVMLGRGLFGSDARRSGHNPWFDFNSATSDLFDLRVQAGYERLSLNGNDFNGVASELGMHAGWANLHLRFAVRWTDVGKDTVFATPVGIGLSLQPFVGSVFSPYAGVMASQTDTEMTKAYSRFTGLSRPSPFQAFIGNTFMLRNAVARSDGPAGVPNAVFLDVRYLFAGGEALPSGVLLSLGTSIHPF